MNPDPAYHGLVYTEAFPAAPYSVKLRAQWIRDIGAGMAPFNAYLSNLGVETLALRMGAPQLERAGAGRIPRKPSEGQLGELSRPEVEQPA